MKLTSTKITLVLSAAVLTAGCGGGSGGGSEPPAGPANAAPTISEFASQTIEEGTETGALAFTIDDAETPAESLSVSVSSSDPNLAPDDGIEVTGSGAKRAVAVFPAAERSGVATITVLVRDAGGAQASSSFELNVRPLLRAEFSGWLRGTVLPREPNSNPVGEPAEDGQPLPQIEDLRRIKIQDDTASDPAAYDDLIPPQQPEV